MVAFSFVFSPILVRSLGRYNHSGTHTSDKVLQGQIKTVRQITENALRTYQGKRKNYRCDSPVNSTGHRLPRHFFYVSSHNAPL
jgi:hypothetical protein